MCQRTFASTPAITLSSDDDVPVWPAVLQPGSEPPMTADHVIAGIELEAGYDGASGGSRRSLDPESCSSVMVTSTDCELGLPTAADVAHLQEVVGNAGDYIDVFDRV